MSIFQEYEEIKNKIGDTKWNTLAQYLNTYNSKFKKEKHLSDILYNKKDYDEFDKWFHKMCKPFELLKHGDCVAIYLDQEYFKSNLFNHLNSFEYYGDGHCWEDIFEMRIDEELSHLKNHCKFDSESGMFCVYVDDPKIADEIILHLSEFYKNNEELKLYINEYGKNIKI